MSLKSLAAATILALMPISAFAQCSYGATEQQAMSCAEGTQWDSVSGTCVPVAST